MGKQKRSENTYQKINTIFMRDAKNVIMPYDPFTEPEFEYLRGLKWRGEEKIDGTNIDYMGYICNRTQALQILTI